MDTKLQAAMDRVGNMLGQQAFDNLMGGSHHPWFNIYPGTAVEGLATAFDEDEGMIEVYIDDKMHARYDELRNK